MSLYRGWRPLLDDVQTHDVAYTKPHDVAEPAPTPVHLRRAQPVSVLLPRTTNWIAQMPEGFRPTSLAKQFPRIANLLCASWGDVPSRQHYLESLLTADRPHRKGFPPAVLRELQRLYAAHLAQSGPNDLASTKQHRE